MKYAWIGIFALLLAACTTDDYDTGDGTYSLMRADFVDMHVNASLQADYVITDDEDSLALSEPFTNKALKNANAYYRALLYYNKVDGKATPVSISLLNYYYPRKTSTIKRDSVFTDPVYFESAWKSKNGRYINIAVNKLTAKVNNEDGVHLMGMVEDTLQTNIDNTKTVILRLLHSQNGVPEYYTSKSYVTLPLSYYRGKLNAGDKIIIRINTYDKGIVEKQFLYE